MDLRLLAEVATQTLDILPDVVPPDINPNNYQPPNSPTPGRWSTTENGHFVNGYLRYGNNWTKVSIYLKQMGVERTREQVRSHAQKWLSKMQQ